MMALRPMYLNTRYVADRAVACVLLVILLPLICGVAIAVVISSGKPVTFRQERVGRYGRSFELMKFRTMVRDAERLGGGYMPKSMNLITPVGRVLRKTSLDELPQLINIARGDMSLIGPRPALRDQYERYTDVQRRRVDVLPGVTGLAQVVHRNDAPWSKRIELDLEYIDRVGPLLDMQILVRTVAKVVSGSGVMEGQRAEDVDDLGR
jgi:lipopolysaccharide/colanic/teichoic acid biosynthesis glycosyltransferase